jgi:hypothetical protein
VVFSLLFLKSCLLTSYLSKEAIVIENLETKNPYARFLFLTALSTLGTVVYVVLVL